jgi:hypothetical protein
MSAIGNARWLRSAAGFVFFLAIVSPVSLAQAVPSESTEETKRPAETDTDSESESAESAGVKSRSVAVPAAAATENAPNSGAALRNENVFASKLDNESAKADEKRLGGSYQPLIEAPVDSGYFAAEYGRSPARGITLAPTSTRNGWHGELFEQLQNSVFNARTYFQAGPVKPSRLNTYGLRFSGALPHWGILSGNWSQIKNRGMVNGNVLVPLLNERTPTASDPATRAFVQRLLSAFPNEAPNRTDIDERALNTNAPQRGDTTLASLRLDGRVTAHSNLSLSHSFSRDNLRAFQLVAGQNPDTAIHTHAARITWTWAPGPNTDLSLTAGYDRARSALFFDPNAVGPSVKFSKQLENLGPAGNYPLNRAENTFREAVRGTHLFAVTHHTLSWGFTFQRYQFNGFEQNGSRGEFSFSNNFGLTAIENLLLGRPTYYDVVIGNMYRGFRSWGTESYIADRWTVNSRLQIYFGLRHGIASRPIEVNGLSEIPYHTDANNDSPRFSLALRAPGNLIVRAGYGISFGQIFPVTYSQIRYNSPGAISVRVNNPSLTNPLAGVPIEPGARSSVTRFSPSLVAPYSHQYSLTLERRIGAVNLQASYIGSRTIKLLNVYHHNRAEIQGYALDQLTSATVNSRRADQNFYDILNVVNGGIAYLDAGQLSWSLRPLRGFTGGGSYTFSKALDNGSSFNSTAANKDRDQHSQYQYNTLQDMKSRSNFDAPHAFTLYGVYRLPLIRGTFAPRFAERAMSSWQVSTNLVFKSGTPFDMSTSDAPGFGNVDGLGGDRPNILDPSILGMTVGDPRTSAQILSRDKFGYIRLGEVSGNLGLNVFRQQAIANVNASIAREWTWKTGGTSDRVWKLRFQGDAYNLTNHAQFASPNNNLSAKVFGKITNTLNTGRVFQFELRLSF